MLAKEDEYSGKTPPLRFITASNDHKILQWEQEESGGLVANQIGDHSSWVRDVAWAPNVGLKHDLLVSVSEAKTDSIRIWIRDQDGWKMQKEISAGCAAWRCEWSPGGSLGVLAVATSDNKTLLYR